MIAGANEIIATHSS